jgi:hypothetical protein
MMSPAIVLSVVAAGVVGVSQPVSANAGSCPSVAPGMVMCWAEDVNGDGVMDAEGFVPPASATSSSPVTGDLLVNLSNNGGWQAWGKGTAYVVPPTDPTSNLATITCVITVDDPHNSGHVPGNVNVSSKIQCTSQVASLSIGVTLVQFGFPVSYDGHSNFGYPFIEANAATLCVSGTYFGVANGTVIFPPGYWPIGGNIEQIGRQVDIRCDAPSFLTLTESSARTAIQQFGAVVGTVTTQPSSARIGTVAAQNPPAGSPLGRGEAVSLVLSSGDAVMPSVYGLSKTDAISAVESAGLVASVHSEAQCIDPQSVIAQSPDAGTRRNRGDIVSIFYDSSTRSSCGVIK